MDSRTAAHVLSQIAAYLELAGENQYKARAYYQAARSVLQLSAEDLGPLLRSGELAQVRGLGKATIAVIADLVETGESSYLERLRTEMPEGLLELMRVPGLSPEKVLKLHSELGITSVDELEQAASNGSLRRLKGMGAKTVEKILASIAYMRDAVTRTLFPHAMTLARGILAAVRSHPDVVHAEIAGALRRRREIVTDIDIVAACSSKPVATAQSFTRVAGVRSATGDGASVKIQFVDGARLHLQCVSETDYAVALWRGTGSEEHVTAVTAVLEKRGLRREGDRIAGADDRVLSFADEGEVYAAAGLEWIAPELRENLGEVEAAAAGRLPRLVTFDAIRGALHCHTTWSDGKSSVAEMAQAARALGWEYLGISDHSQAAFYASGVLPDQMLEQHDEIDALNRKLDGFRVLKGVEADILADGRLDYDEKLLSRFDYVIASIHSRFRMKGAAITERVLTAMDDPHMTILAHPTGRLLLSREPYELDIEAVLAKAKAKGIAVELNADPHRLDLDWRYIRRAKELGVTVEIGPDAHSTRSLEWTGLGVEMARKGWLETPDVLNARSADEVIAFARSRRA